MTSLVSCRRLLAGTALVAASLGLSSPASAQCVRSGNDLTCDTTQTVDLISDGSSPSADRYQFLDVRAGDSTVTILSGRTVSQAGLAVDSWPTCNATLRVVNQGTVMVDSGISGVFMGGNAALSMIGNGAANLDYRATGRSATRRAMALTDCGWSRSGPATFPPPSEVRFCRSAMA